MKASVLLPEDTDHSRVKKHPMKICPPTQGSWTRDPSVGSGSLLRTYPGFRGFK